MPNKERLLAKGKYFFQLEASGKDVRFTDNGWTEGHIFLTDTQVWFYSESHRMKIPISCISSIGRVEHRPIPVHGPFDRGQVLVIDYGRAMQDGSMGSSTAIVYGPENSVNIMRRYLNDLLKWGPMVDAPEVDGPNDIENRLLMMFYMGVKDRGRIAFMLGTKVDGFIRMLDRLVSFGYVDPTGNLTAEGLAYTSGLGKPGEKEVGTEAQLPTRVQ
jgi:helix-turn-helix protein